MLDTTPLDNHLRNALTSQCFATNKVLVLQAGKRVEKGGQDEEDGSCNQARRSITQAGPLNSAEDCVHGGTHVVGGEATDEVIKFGGCRADSKEEWDFNEDDDEGRGAARFLSTVHSSGQQGGLTCK